MDYVLFSYSKNTEIKEIVMYKTTKTKSMKTKFDYLKLPVKSLR